MKMMKLLSMLAIGGFLLTACAGLSGGPSSTPGGSDQNGPGGGAVAPGPVNAARQALAEKLGRPVSDVSIKTFAVAEWPDSCLGLGTLVDSCASVITRGYNVELMVDGLLYIYRTDENGQVVRFVPEDKFPDAVLAALKDLAATAGVDEKSIVITSFSLEDWPDSCLGAAAPDEMCSQVITRGYKVVMQANGKVYIYHTDATGKNLRVEGGQSKATPANEPGAIAAARKTLATRLGLDPANVKVVSYEPKDWPDSCLGAAGPGEMCLQVITPGFRVILNAANQRYEVHTDKGGKSVRLVQKLTTGGEPPIITWRRTGGIAGFCDILEISLTGEARAMSCQGDVDKDLGVTRLTDEELRQVTDWAGRLSAFELVQSDPATADAMSINLTFSGNGVANPTEDVKQAILVLAGQVFQRIASR